ncbi:MAG TPA: hypothetical protein VLJ39_01365, partial [Tepidisphaeraceae bacterium]|nr:hypothetical protein [Tepidisphaeraceae bacterium]
KYEGREQDMLKHSPVIQDESLRGTSSWSNTYLEKDHNAHHAHGAASMPLSTDKPASMQSHQSDSPKHSAGENPAPRESENVIHVTHSASPGNDPAFRAATPPVQTHR